jgi:hypothetical protein
MIRDYTSVCSAAIATSKSHQTIYQPASGLTIRPRFHDILLGSPASPSDLAIQLSLYRTTTAPGTPVAITPAPVEPTDAAAVTLASKQATAEPTLGVLLMSIPMNQRITFRFACMQGSEIPIPFTVSYGLTLYCTAANINGSGSTTPTLDSTIWFYE